jgi:transcription termination factor Rho
MTKAAKEDNEAAAVPSGDAQKQRRGRPRARKAVPKERGGAIESGSVREAPQADRADNEPQSQPVAEKREDSSAPANAGADRGGSQAEGRRGEDQPAAQQAPAREAASEPQPPRTEPVAAPNNGGGAEASDRTGGTETAKDAAGSPAPVQAGAQGQGRGHPSGGQGEWQDRKFWKHNKRKRGRFGNWQPGQGGGPQHPQHPPQPAPPSAAVLYGDLPNPARFVDLAALDALAAEISSGPDAPLYLDQLYALNLADLTAFAREKGVPLEGAPNRKQLLALLFAQASAARRPILTRGYVDMTDRGAFIVHEHVNYRLYPEDPYLPESLIRRYGLKRGHKVSVLVQAPAENERCPAVVRIDDVMGLKPEEISKVTPFEELIPYYPLQRILLEAPAVQKDVSMRAVDILTPIGFGQRGLIVAPPRTGKTVLLQNIANSVSENSPEVKLILLLIDERPEEVTDFRRHTKGEVVSSTFDESPESHVHCAEMVGEKARRIVESGGHVVILLDSITRLARAYNSLASNAGKIMSGGLEATALQKPKRFFGAARNIEGGGSLTIVATALIDTGSRMDEVIFEEFKGTGNMELHLDRGLVDRRIFPSINIDRSGTRKEELIYHPEELQRIYGLRRAMQGLGPIESMEMLIQRLKKTKSNAEFLLTLSRQ